MDIEAATGGAAGAAGGGDATSAYNQGIILVNQSKMADAKTQFQKAIQMNPNMSEAYYQLAMCQANENDMNGAKTNLTKYLQLAPTGPNAQTAKDILAALK
jgi:TolA-binding protein